MTSNMLFRFVLSMNLLCLLNAIVAHEYRYEPNSSSNTFHKNIHTSEDKTVVDKTIKTTVDLEIKPSEKVSLEKQSQVTGRKGKQFMTIFPRSNHLAYQNLHQRLIPLQYRYPYFLMNPTYKGVNRHWLMPEDEKSVVLLNGEKEKKKKNTDLSNKSDDIEFDVIARSRVGNTINSLNQGQVTLNKSVKIESSPDQKEKILGRANYFAHRLSIDAETPLHLQNENTLITNTNNDIDQQDFLITASTRNITGTRPFDVDLNNPRDCCLFIFLDGSAFYLDDFLEKLTGFYRLMSGTVNGYPHFVARSCRNPNVYGNSCTYIWYSGFGWVVGVGRYIGQTKGVMYTQNSSFCPTDIGSWRYLNQDLKWMDNGNISVTCAS